MNWYSCSVSSDAYCRNHTSASSRPAKWQTCANLSKHLDFAILGLNELSCFHESAQEGVGRREGQLEAERVEHLDFHLQHLVTRVGIVADVDKFVNLGRVNFLVFPVPNELYSCEGCDQKKKKNRYAAMSMQLAPTSWSFLI